MLFVIPVPMKFLPRFIVVSLAFALGACTKRETRVEAGNRTQSIHIGNLSEPNDLDPQIADSTNTVTVIMAFMEGLAQYDPKTSAPVPAAAERWEVAPDNLTWTFHLRRNGRWSNGDPVTARDFVFAFRRMLSPGLGAEYASMLHALKNGAAFNAGTIPPSAHNPIIASGQIHKIGSRAVTSSTTPVCVRITPATPMSSPK